MSQTIRHRTVTDQVADSLRRQIIRRELEPGVRITQDELAKNLGVSTMPVREALLRLTAEGLISASPNRSFNVVSTTADDIRDLFWVHGILAGELTRRAARSVDPEFLQRLTAHHKAYLVALEREDQDQMYSTNWTFFHDLYEQAASPKLALVLRNTLRFFPDFGAGIPTWFDVATRQQKQVLAALRKGDGEKAAAAIVDGLKDAVELYLKHFHIS